MMFGNVILDLQTDGYRNCEFKPDPRGQCGRVRKAHLSAEEVIHVETEGFFPAHFNRN